MGGEMLMGVSDEKQVKKRPYRPTTSDEVALLRPLALMYHSGDCGSGLKYSASLRKQVLVRASEILDPGEWDRLRIRRWLNNEGKKIGSVARPGREGKVPVWPTPRTLPSLGGVDATCEDVPEQVEEETSDEAYSWSLYDPTEASWYM